MLRKSWELLGQAEAICTGTLAGHNAVRYALGMPMLILPRSIAIGDLIAFANYKLSTKQGRRNRYTFAGAEYFQRMKEQNLYTTDKEEIRKRITKLNLEGALSQKLV